jgi:UDP-N-acetylglucosamine 1-carboxyvinyltransferase
VDKIRIQGGRRLEGRVWVSGSKNASLPILAAALLVDGPIVLDGVPHLADVENMLYMLSKLGLKHEWQDDDSLRLEVVDDSIIEAPYHLVRTMRASFCLIGPLWARRGKAIVSYPGGCVFGHRPVDLHLKGLRALGARLDLEEGNVHASGPVRGGHIFLGGSFGSTVLGTANVLTAAVLAEGRSTIEYAAQEPEIVDLCEFLLKCGAKIKGIGSHRLEIEGVERLTGCRHEIIADRIEAGTLLMAGIMTRGEVQVLGARPDHLGAVLDRLREAGAPIEVGEIDISDAFGIPGRPHHPRLIPLEGVKRGKPLPSDKPRSPGASSGSIGQGNRDDILMAYRFRQNGRPPVPDPASKEPEERVPYIKSLPWDRLECVDAVTMPYPGFPTDLQAQFLSLMCIAEGVSVVTEKIYPDRFIHVAELNRLGAQIRREGPSAIVKGAQSLGGATIMASDLRASAALILAGLVARGTTEVRRVYHLDRGYERLEDKLRGLGAEMERVGDH